MTRNSYPKTARLRRRGEYVRVQRTGRRTHTQSFVIVHREGSAENARLGVTVSSKIGNAVTRNRIKRRVRECFRTRRDEVPSDLDIVVIAKKGADGLSFHETVRELTTAFQAMD